MVIIIIYFFYCILCFTLDFFSGTHLRTVRTGSQAPVYVHFEGRLNSANKFNSMSSYQRQITSLCQSNYSWMLETMNTWFCVILVTLSGAVSKLQRLLRTLPPTAGTVAGIKKPGLHRVKEFILSPTHTIYLYPMLCHKPWGFHCGR